MKKPQTFLLIFVALLLFGMVAPTNPGAKVTLTQPLFDKAVQVLLPYVEQEIKNIKIPDISGDYHSPIGKIEYSISSVVLNSFNLGGASIKITSTGFKITASGGSFSMGAHWHWREHSWPHISDSGSLTAKGSGITAVVDIVIGENAGKPTITCSSATISIGSVKVDFHGGDSWLYNLFDGIIDKAIRKAVEKQFNSLVTKQINDAAVKFLASIPFVMPIAKDVEVDYKLTSGLIFTPGKHFTIPSKAEFYYTPNPKEYTPGPVALPNIETSEMVQAFVSSFVSNSISKSFWETKAMYAVITNNNLPAWFPYKMNTKDWKDLIPALYTAYPDRNMEVILQADTWPKVEITSAGIQLSFVGSANVNILADSTHPEVQAFVLTATGGCDVAVKVNSTAVFGTFSNLKTDVKLTKTNIGQFSLNSLQTIINLMETSVITPLIQKFVANGYPIPLPKGAALIDPKVIYHTGYFTISTSMTYVMSEEN
ncbi:bactericidal permeability-increasing bpi protein-related [Anaeramoeba flamelloides]|uniref:Bactericidal permeability-increasing bpi protein-related n=1 Tax=Anaeramoeba flamelloides TaxID=1746091 RepID=A0AAV7ZMI4_9EUKA|nr:bactericidal permeability-increasing bpi protein-related [Anaeramoeba flamelloides]